MVVCICKLCIPLRWPLRDLLKQPIPWYTMAIAACLIVAAVHTLWLLEGGGIPYFHPIFLLFAVCAGVTEELLFRGFLLNSHLAVMPPVAAIALNSLLFLLIHYTDMMFGLSPLAMLSKRGAVILIMGAVFSWITIKTRCLKVPILMHILWNTLVYFYGIY